MKPAVTSVPQTSGTKQGGRSTQRRRDGFPFLKKETHLSPVKKLFRVIDCREQPDNFKPDEELVMVKIALEGTTLLWPLRYNNPNLKTLQDAWGLREADWKDKTGSLFTEVQDFDGTSQIRVEPDTEQRRKR